MPDRRLRKTAQEYLDQASKFQEDGQVTRAIAEVMKAARVSSEKGPVYRNLARLYRSRRKMDDAIEAIQKAIKANPRDTESREMLLEMLLELGKFEQAIVEAKNLLRISPRSMSARDVLSIAYLQIGLLEKAIQVTNELITLDPTSAANHFKKAVLFQQKGEVGSAIHEFGRVLEMGAELDMANEAREAIDTLDSYQLRHIVMLAVEDYIFRAKLIHDPESAAMERGYYLSYSGMSALKQIQFDDLTDVYSEWKQKYYH
jgi:tetratricopeptide (TPR) repeat protein